MNRFIRRAVIGTAAAAALAVPALPAAAAPVITGGLINVTIVDVLSGNQVNLQVPVSVAANICDVAVGVLAQDLANGGPTDCSNTLQTITVSRQNR